MRKPSFTSLKKYEDQTLSLLAQVLTNPGLRPADIERKRAEIVAAINAEEESPHYVAEVTFGKTLFGPDNPYGHPPEGFKDTAAKLTPDDVTKFYHDFYKMGGAIIAVAGDVTADEIKAKLEQQFASLQGTVPPQPMPPAPTVAPGLHPHLIDQNVAQANVGDRIRRRRALQSRLLQTPGDEPYPRRRRTHLAPDAGSAHQEGPRLRCRLRI